VNKAQKKNNPQLKPFAPHRVRQVRPDLFTNETFADLSMTARVAFIGLTTCCDKNGRFEWRPRTLKSHIFPHDSLDFETIVAELERFIFVYKYFVDGAAHGQVVNWHSFQYIGNKESKQADTYPPPQESPKTSEIIPERSKTFQNVPDPAKTLGVCVDVSVDANVFEGVHAKGNNTGHSILLSNDGTNDSPSLSDKDSETESDIESLEKLFHRENDRTTFRPGRKQKTELTALVFQHGLDVVSKAVEFFAAEEGHNWSEAICPAAIFLKGADYYVGEAIKQLDSDREWSVRNAAKQAQAGVQ